MSEIVKLEYGGVTIRNDKNGEMLNLTDMWKACGSDPSKKPADWQRKEGKAFVEFIAENLNMPTEHIDIIRTNRGGKTPGTWAHWQIGMAYAKYLSHEFHAQCNAIVRAHMEGRLVGQDTKRNKWLERVVLSLPKAREPQWKDAIDVLAKLLRQPAKNSQGGAPVWLGSVSGKLSRMRFGEDIQKAIKALADDSGARHYEHMTDDTIRALKELLHVITFAASHHSSYEGVMDEIQRYCDFTNGLGAQLLMPLKLGLAVGLAVPSGNEHCPDCGTKPNEAAAFCHACGKRLAA